MLRYKTPKLLEIAIDNYFKSCVPEAVLDKDGKVILDQRGNPVYRENPPTMAGLALALGYKSRQSLYDAEATGDGFADVISKARTYVEAYHERNLCIRDRCVGDIFWMKNHGWRDEQTVTGDLRVASVSLSADEEAEFKRNMALFFGRNGA